MIGRPRTSIKKQCIICSKEIWVNPYRLIKNRGKFCSPECYSEYRKSLPKCKQNAWKGGLATNKKYRALCILKHRHKKGISKKYRVKGKRFPKKYHRQRYKALKKKGGRLPVKRIQLVYEDNIKKYGTLTCYLCEKPIQFGKDSLEHKIPLSRGGTNEYNNLAIAHGSCNCKKHNKTEEEYRNAITV